MGVLPHPDRCVSYGKTCQGSRARDGKRMGKDNRSVHYEADHLCAGRYVSYGSAKWKKAKKISSAASTVKIKRAGFYTMRIYKTNGRIRYTVVKLKKKTYTIAANEASKIKKGIYFIQMKGGAMADVLDGCLAAGTNVRLLKNHKIASSMWEAEKVKGLYIRLKNVGTGQYLTLDDLGNAVAAPLRDGDESFTFRALKAGGKYQYLWNKGREVFLRSGEKTCKAGFGRKRNRGSSLL